MLFKTNVNKNLYTIQDFGVVASVHSSFDAVFMGYQGWGHVFCHSYFCLARAVKTAGEKSTFWNNTISADVAQCVYLLH